MLDKTKPELFFLTIAIITGTIAVFLIPIGAGYDEDTHVARIWEISSLRFIPNQLYITGPHLPSIFYELSYRQKFIIEPVEKGFWEKYKNKRIDWDVMINHRTRSIYNPILYLPQAFIMGLLGRYLDVPILIIYYLCRFICLASFIIPAYLAIKIIPFGKWLFTLLALSPMSLFQASTITPDSISNGVSLLFIAYIFYFARAENPPITRRDRITFLLMVALLFILKINSVVLILLFFIIPFSRFQTKRNYITVLSTIIILFLILVVGWNIIAISQESVIAQGPGTNSTKQLFFILSHPLTYLQMVINNIFIKFNDYYRSWVGVFGYGYWVVPKAIYIVFAILLSFVLFTDTPLRPRQLKTLIILTLTTIIGYVLSVTIIYITINHVGSSHIGYVQGRYFIPIMPPILIMLLSTTPKIQFRISKAVIQIGIAILIFIYLGAAYLAYHVNCGTSYYTHEYCYQPVYKNWDPNSTFSPTVTTKTVINQKFLVKCNTLETIRIWTYSKSVVTTGVTNFKLIESATGNIYLDQSITNLTVPVQDWLNLSLTPMKDSINKRYELVVTSTDASKDNGIRLAISPREEYTDGELSINNEKQDADLIFQYGCNIHQQ